MVIHVLQNNIRNQDTQIIQECGHSLALSKLCQPSNSSKNIPRPANNSEFVEFNVI